MQTSDFKNYQHPYTFSPKYEASAAYFCMEFGIDQALKIYSGGLGYLAGSHMRSAYALRQNMIGVGILWKYGYYDQVRKPDQTMDALFMERNYNFLQETGIKFSIQVNRHPVWVTAYYLSPEVFGTAPLFFLSTDLPENDLLSRSICNRLYDSNVETKIAQYILLGKGGARLLEEINRVPETYHLNEAHGLPAAFHLYEKFGKNVERVKEHLVFTTHTPVAAGNEQHSIYQLDEMGYFGDLTLNDARAVSQVFGDSFSHSLVALRMARLSNGVSAIHGGVARQMWSDYEGVCPITHITNAQNAKFWTDKGLKKALDKNNDEKLRDRKAVLKARLFEEVAHQTGKLFDPNVCTMVWARRFAGYKRADMLTKDMERFTRLMHNSEHPIQIIWAGKPYPQDYTAISTFNHLVQVSKSFKNVAVLTGYEMSLSKLTKCGSDLWLNTPRLPREASGTSGMTAAMNASVNLSTFDGWIPEFARAGENAFIVPPADKDLDQHVVDIVDRDAVFDLLEKTILPMYYEQPDAWLSIVKNSMQDVVPFFDSDRMANQYYEKLYRVGVEEVV